MRILRQLLALLILTAGCHGAKDSAAPEKTAASDARRVIIVTGIDYPGHPWQQTAPALADLLRADPRLLVDVVEDPNFLASPQLARYDTIVLHFMNWETPDPGPEARSNLQQSVAEGKGLVLVHFACNKRNERFPKLSVAQVTSGEFGNGRRYVYELNQCIPNPRLRSRSGRRFDDQRYPYHYIL